MRYDTANLHVDMFDRAPLIFTEEQLAALAFNNSNEVIEYVPGFKWWEADERRKMNRDDNITGHVQRAWEFYWSLRYGIQQGNICLGIGTGAVGSPGTLTTDKYCGASPHTVRYPNPNGYSHMTLDADVLPWPFHTDTFGCVTFNHSFEHLEDQAGALQEAMRVIKGGGVVCILQPCMSFCARKAVDPTHTTEWSADSFLRYVGLTLKGFDYTIIAHNLIDTAFSFDTVIMKAEKKKGVA